MLKMPKVQASEDIILMLIPHLARLVIKCHSIYEFICSVNSYFSVNSYHLMHLILFI